VDYDSIRFNHFGENELNSCASLCLECVDGHVEGAVTFTLRSFDLVDMCEFLCMCYIDDSSATTHTAPSGRCSNNVSWDFTRTGVGETTATGPAIYPTVCYKKVTVTVTDPGT
jgi:hypothetical protein